MVFATLSINLGVWWPGNHPDRILGSQSRDCLYSCVQALLKQNSTTGADASGEFQLAARIHAPTIQPSIYYLCAPTIMHALKTLLKNAVLQMQTEAKNAQC